MDAKKACFTFNRMKAIDIKKNFGKVVAKRRRELGITQEEMAALSGISDTYYGNVERGENSISIEKQDAIAKTLGVPLWILVREAEEFNI